MKQFLKNFGYYFILPIAVMVLLIFMLNDHFKDLEKSINISATIIQALAIFIGGLWAYHKFDWNKRAESAIKLKAMLMEYEQMHNEAAMQYRVDQHDEKDWLECWRDFSIKMIPPRNQFNSQVHLSCYIPKKVRLRLFDVVWLSLNKGKSPKNESLDDNWKKFGKELPKVKDELDNLATK
jgi:signal transduction histidine kinase